MRTPGADGVTSRSVERKFGLPLCASPIAGSASPHMVAVATAAVSWACRLLVTAGRRPSRLLNGPCGTVLHAAPWVVLVVATRLRSRRRRRAACQVSCEDVETLAHRRRKGRPCQARRHPSPAPDGGSSGDGFDRLMR